MGFRVHFHKPCHAVTLLNRVDARHQRSFAVVVAVTVQTAARPVGPRASSVPILSGVPREEGQGRVPCDSFVTTYADSPFKCARSDFPSAGAWESGNAWTLVSACSPRLNRLRPEWPAKSSAALCGGSVVVWLSHSHPLRSSGTSPPNEARTKHMLCGMGRPR